MNKVAIEPVYQTFDGWQTDITDIKDYENVPEKMKTYIQYINNFVGVPVKYISNGPGREQIIVAG
jgi:adenylosuccinate synthase